MNPTDGLKPGRIVYFVFDAASAATVHSDRVEASVSGNAVKEGNIYPAMVVACWGETSVNLKVMLDGPDMFWATSVEFSDEKTPRSWHWMFEGQNTRYQPDRVEKAS